jgi:multidrug resistance efflux pump
MDHPAVLTPVSEINQPRPVVPPSSGNGVPSALRRTCARPRQRLFSPWLLVLGFLCAVVAVSSVMMPSWSQPAQPSESVKPPMVGVAMALVDVEEGVHSLYPARPGRIIETPFQEGDEVEKGAVLLKTDDWLARKQHAEAEVDLAIARQKLEQARVAQVQHEEQLKMLEASLTAARKKHQAALAQMEKARRYLNEGINGSVEDVTAATRLAEEAEAAIEVEKARIRLLEASRPELTVSLAELNVRAKQEQLDKAARAIEEHKLLAPCKGRILRRLVRVGEVLGSNPVRPALEFAAGQPIVRAEFEQEFAGELQLGQTFTIYDYITHSEKPIAQGKVIRLGHWYAQRRVILFEPMQFNDVRTREVIIGDLQLKQGAPPLLINQRVRVQRVMEPTEEKVQTAKRDSRP